MRPLVGVVVIIAGVVMFTRADSASISAIPPESVTDAREARRDLYGNEILPAVADYVVDPYGEMYERHAPDTALLELTEPSS
jgi:hypothetical protein